MIGGDGNRVDARSMTRRPEPNRWTADKLANVKITPWSLRGRSEANVRFEAPIATDGAATEVAKPSAPKEFRINQSDIVQRGCTDGCPQCTYTGRNGKARAGGRHLAICRTRIMEAIRQTQPGKKRMAEYEGRLTRTMAEYPHPGVEDRDRAVRPVAG